MEIWKPIRNFPGYDASTEGRIINVRTQHILKPAVDKYGSAKVTLRKDGRQYTVKVRRIIAETFIDDCAGMDVRNIDGDPLNNRPDNLEICTRSKVIGDAYERGSKKPYQSRSVRVVETGRVYDSIKECAAHIGCDRSEISKHLAGKRPSVKGYHFTQENTL